MLIEIMIYDLWQVNDYCIVVIKSNQQMFIRKVNNIQDNSILFTTIYLCCFRRLVRIICISSRFRLARVCCPIRRFKNFSAFLSLL